MSQPTGLPDRTQLGHHMTAQAMATPEASIAIEERPRYMHAVVAVARSATAREWSVVHLGSGKFFRTDRMGARAIRAMIDGRSDLEAIADADRLEAGAAERAARLVEGLATTGALAWAAPALSSSRWRLRRFAAIAIGHLLSVAGRLAVLTPVSLLAWLFRLLPGSPITGHVWRSGRSATLANLRSSGYGDRATMWLDRTGRGSAAFAPVNSTFMYLGPAVQAARLGSLVERLVDAGSADRLARQVEETGATIGVFLHSGLCAVVPNALRRRGVKVIRAAVPEWHGVYLSSKSGAMRDYWGDPPETTVAVSDPLATAQLVRHLKAGSSVYIALDRMAFDRRPATIELLGHSFPRNDGPAWLAVRSGRPVSLWSTYDSPSGLVVSASPPFYADSSLPPEERVAAVSEHLYGLAEKAIRAHPESWAGWSYLSLIISA
jgi:lauroyl/myristoyl acyltransferase